MSTAPYNFAKAAAKALADGERRTILAKAIAEIHGPSSTIGREKVENPFFVGKEPHIP